VFDPVSGAETPVERIEADNQGHWLCPPPSGQDHDWLLVLVRVQGVSMAR
jgi:hypothetical protein